MTGTGERYPAHEIPILDRLPNGFHGEEETIFLYTFGAGTEGKILGLDRPVEKEWRMEE